MPLENHVAKNIRVDLIEPNQNQPRLHYDPIQLSELADSISKVGLINPITVRKIDDHFILQTGSRRLEACRLLRQEFILAYISDVDNTTDVCAMLHENLFRTDLSPYEEGVSFIKLIEVGGYDIKRLCHLTNKPESYISARIKLISLPEEIQTFVHDGLLPISHALELSKISDIPQLLQYAKYAVDSGSNLQTVRYWVQQYFAALNAPKAPGQAPAAIPEPMQMPSFGWNCFVCEKHTEATICKTIHICPDCFTSLHAQIHIQEK